MSDKIQVNAEVRTAIGRGASRRLRRDGTKVPGIIYGGERAPENLVMNSFALAKSLEQEAFFSQVLNVVVDGKPQQAVVRDIQRNPANERVIHIDFLRIRADRPIHVYIPIHFLNEDSCKGVRLGGGIIARTLNEVEVSCLPGDLPEFIEIDLQNLDLNESIHLSDLRLPQGVEILELTHGEDHDQTVVVCNPPRLEGEAQKEDADETTDEADEGSGKGESEEASDED
ncbi:MAG: 50S ribosomal protein L25/general stress protein Ctc [Proteobacteria bacterium]|nr:50S ribosomal protein L25/general stress protein Ctc [Pseudomonadota bacterium]